MTHYSPVIAALVTLILALLLSLNKKGILQDVPNERSLHSTPIPRHGGIALMVGIGAAWFFLAESLTWWLIVPLLGLFTLSLMDDVRDLTPKIRLIGHFSAATVVVLGAGVDWLWWLPVLFFIVWVTNLYNFMDGSDGLAGGMAFFGFSFYGVAALMQGDDSFAMMNFSVGAAALGFLYHNLHPARVFMGDAGSISLGFLAATLGVWGWQSGYWSFWFPILVFSPFIVDATITLFARVRRREKLSQAHRSHYYQRLVQMGFGHRNTAIAEYVLMLLVGISALISLDLSAYEQGNLLAWWAAIYLALMMWVDRRWRQFTAKQEAETDVS
jgi:UDP-N-acetylmuramyl pentapeptide phosphotransferase/UDP-N-acetylglucosamine-1-phosphate transferase